jgi:hypothetical protein
MILALHACIYFRDKQELAFGNYDLRRECVTLKEWFVGLPGIHCGQFWEPIDFRK